MFTGIVEELGTVTAVHHEADSARLTITGPTVNSDATHGASISVNGVCLTVVDSVDHRSDQGRTREHHRRPDHLYLSQVGR